MTEIRERWEKLPRIARGALLITLGAAAATTADRVIDSTEHRAIGSKRQIAFSVGVVCTSSQAAVSYTHTDGTYTFSCESSTTPSVEVSKLVSIRKDHPPTIPGYSGIIDLEGTGDTIAFGLQGPNGTATIMQETEADVAHSTNRNETGIIRVTTS